ncbi:hypothetical protein EV421DRAFT_2031783 [Armillaria borealis]|uniref:Uncharacterized protein n=1 Tax=Armillaria borealis TaxID=47425 RepID=A0AA39K0B5_9AGAR|nr:hypothetical protein EV421DRAFT_2031783 [Armillaria borealis]
MAAIYSVYTSPTHPPIPDHLPTLIVTPHGQPSNILYSYLHTNFNSENYLLTPSPQGDLCVAKLFPPRPKDVGKASASDPASRNLKWSIANTGVISPIYKLSLPSPDSADLPLFQISKPNPNAAFWSMFYFAYAGHNIPPKRIEFGKIQKNPPGPNGGGTRISITGKTAEEKAVWQTLGEGNEDCVEWVVLCAALNLLEYVPNLLVVYLSHVVLCLSFAATKLSRLRRRTPLNNHQQQTEAGPSPVSLRDPGPATNPSPRPPANIPQQQPRPTPQHANTLPPRVNPGPGFQGQPMPQRGFPPGQGPPGPGYGAPPPQGYHVGAGPGPHARPPPSQMRPGMAPGPGHMPGAHARPPQQMMPGPMQQQQQMPPHHHGQAPQQVRRF